MKVSVLLPFSPADARAGYRVAELVAEGTADRFWMGHSFGVDSLHVMSYLAGAGLPVPCGLSVGLAPLRTAYDAALQARSAAVLTQQPFVLGLGIGNPGFARAVTGRSRVRPSHDTVHQVRQVRLLLEGGVLPGDGGGTDDGSPVGLLPVAAPAVEVGAGVLRPRHAAAVGEVADVAITLLTPRQYLTDTLVPALRDGADRAGRSCARVVSIVHVATARPGRDLATVMTAAAGGHLDLPHYRRMLEMSGAVSEGATTGEAITQLLDSGVLAVGSEDEVVDHVLALRAAGVDEVILNAGGVFALEGMARMVDELRSVAHALRSTVGRAVAAR